MHHAPRFAAAALVATLGLSACGGDDDSTSTADTTAAAADTTTASSDTTTATSGDFSVNDASQEEIAAVLDAAGVPSADQWAREVVEYRPYDVTDTDMTHLRDELAKYNPAPEVVDQIVAALQA